ncbi:MAG TPA: HD domain-containing phosphohydrolase [Candidatus Obscuribacterales bacterium]
MKHYPLFYLRPVCDSLMEQILPLLAPRFDAKGFHHSDLGELLEESSAPWILVCDSESFEFMLQYYGSAPFQCFLILGENEKPQPEWLTLESLLDFSQGPPDAERLVFALSKLYSQLLRTAELERLTHLLDVQRHRLQDLNEIGAALSTERNLDRLLDKILASSMEITSSDSGSLYLVEAKNEGDDDPEHRHLRFKWARNQSIDVDFSEFTIDMNERSIAGSVALHGTHLNIPDVYDMDPNLPYGFNKSFDQNTGYHARSMLTMPMKNPHGEVIGILQMINKKKNWSEPLKLKDPEALQAEILTFSREDEDLLFSLASQAAVAIENARLYAAIQSLFEGFIRASVQAIESRDPTTSGHSERVAVLTVGLAQEADRRNEGPFSAVKFSRDEIKEIKYASLLHDFGKIGVRENVLVKADKLYTHELDNIKHRFRLVRKNLENEYNLRRLQILMKNGPEAAEALFTELEHSYLRDLAELEKDMDMILQANKPTILDQAVSEHLKLIQQKSFNCDAEVVALLDEFELSRLSIARGSLDPDERLEIESHVTHTFHFLSQIPWTRELRNVPQIAYAHHEKLNGRGYPRKLAATEIPIQSKMMTIADIYDALTASDRPYKKALPAERALDILGYEVKDGMLDQELYKLFVEAKVYEQIVPS